MDLGTLLPRHSRYRAEHLAVVFEDRRIRYRELNARVDQVAQMLSSLGVRPGDRVATVLPNCLELLELYWAAAALGCVIVPMSPLLNAGGLRSLLTDCRPRVVVATRAFAEDLARLRSDVDGWTTTLFVDGDTDEHAFSARVQEASSDPVVRPPLPGSAMFNICYSSGTTGQPKGIVHTHDIRAHYGSHFAAAFRITPESRVLHTGSIVFNGAWVTMLPCFFMGATYVLTPAFEPARFIEIVRRERITHVMVVPSQLVALLELPDWDEHDLGSLQMVLSLGAPLLDVHKRALEARLPGRFHELYGLTEGFITVLDKHDVPRKPGSVGAPLPLSEMRICDDEGRDLPPGEIGEIVGRGPMLTPGYYGQPELTAEAIRDGWLHTGDLGYADEDGFLFLVDRKKDLIISGGVNVYPKDIEEIVARHPAVGEVAVFGVEHARWGEAPVAAVVLSSAATEVSRDELLAWTNERVSAKFQRLADVVFVDAMPRNVAGKTLKRELRARYREGQ